MSHIDPEKVYRGLMQAGENWADKLGAAELKESALKSLLAHLTIDAKQVEKCSDSSAKDIALSSNTYRDAAIDAIEARREANRAKVGYASAQALFEAQRSAEASARAAESAQR